MPFEVVWPAELGAGAGKIRAVVELLIMLSVGIAVAIATSRPLRIEEITGVVSAGADRPRRHRVSSV